jgi:anti-sigma-K factor RskA
MSNKSHVTDLIPAYALNILDADEAEGVTQHLQTCPSCREELASYQAVTGQLGFAAPDEAPSPALKKRLMKGVQKDGKTAVSSPSLTIWQQWKTAVNNAFARPAWQPALALVVIALVVSNLYLWQQLQEARQPSTFPAITLHGTESAPDASGFIAIGSSGQSGTLVVDSLPSLDDAYQYQLWLIAENEERTSGGVFSVNDDGYHTLQIAAPQQLTDYPAFGITIEPAGGSPGPTGQQVLGSS